MRWFTVGLLAIIVGLQYPLWFGKGSWLKVWEYNQQLGQYEEATQKLEQRNAVLDAEIRDLRQGYDAIEERARFELGMVRQGELFVSTVTREPR
jgi:cell division protein FtsB